MPNEDAFAGEVRPLNIRPGVDTRSDIHSLGVLLYELLVGKTPFEPRELLSTGLDGLRRTIVEKEPARPSARLSRLAAEDLTTTTQHRGVEAPKLISLLQGDLDWIVMKCLEKVELFEAFRLSPDLVPIQNAPRFNQLLTKLRQ